VKKLENSEFIKKLRAKDPKIDITFNAERSAIAMARGKITPPMSVAKLKETPYAEARRFIKENSAILGDIDGDTELSDERATTDHRDMTHVAFGQRHGNAIVLGASLSIHYMANGAIYMIKSNLAPAIDLPTKPKLTSGQAIKIAQKHASRNAVPFEKMKPALVVVDAKTLHLENEEQKYYLCWQLGILAPSGKGNPDWIYLVDAIGGKVLLRYSALQTGTGTGYYSTGAALNSELSGAIYRLRDTVTSSGWPVAAKPAIHTYDDAGSSSCTLTNYSEDADDIWGDTAPPARVDNQRPEVDLHRFIGYVLNYYYATFGYNSWDGAGADVQGHTHNEYYNNNAFWSSFYHQIYFADGDGTSYDFMCPLDVVAHELTHGVNHGFNIVQTYDGETGALNEAIADLFGYLIATDYPADCPQPWIHGDQYNITGHGRNMADPARDEFGVVQYDATNNTTKYNSAVNGYYPDHYSIRYTGSSDYHGVHINCPIISHAVYLMIAGGTNRVSGIAVTAIGAIPIEQMLYHVISTPGLLTNSSDFGDFRLAFIEACQTLYPDNLDYLATVKTAFLAVGIGPDLYIRDTLADTGNEPGTLSCMSPDIILRQQPADAAALTLISDTTNGSLCEQIELGPNDHYVYFRIFNRGADAASGTFRLFISPVSTFPTPASWTEVGHYDFPSVASGGLWVPTAANECITLTSAVINALGIGHFCFIGIIESTDDPAPDRTLISSVSEFHDFISHSNNYAWRNCDIVDLIPDAMGNIPITDHTFQINDLDGKDIYRELEIDAHDLPEGTQVIMLMPATKLIGLKAFEAQVLSPKVQRVAMNKAGEEAADGQMQRRQIPLTQLATASNIGKTALAMIKERELKTLRPLYVTPGKVIQLAGITTKRKEKVNVRFIVKFPKNAGTRDATLAFRERTKDGVIGQMNYVFRIREGKNKQK
jgi:Zn-dependent metalloprotease